MTEIHEPKIPVFHGLMPKKEGDRWDISHLSPLPEVKPRSSLQSLTLPVGQSKRS